MHMVKKCVYIYIINYSKYTWQVKVQQTSINSGGTILIAPKPAAAASAFTAKGDFEYSADNIMIMQNTLKY